MRDRLREPQRSHYIAPPSNTVLLNDLERFLSEIAQRFRAADKVAWDKLGAAKGIVEILRERL